MCNLSPTFPLTRFNRISLHFFLPFLKLTLMVISSENFLFDSKSGPSFLFKLQRSLISFFVWRRMKSFAGAYSMKGNRRLFGFLASGRFEFERKVSGLNKYLSITLFCFFLGFILGNLFGTFLSGFRQIFHWDGFIIFYLLGFIEITNYANYDPKGKKAFFISRNEFAWKMCNFLKIGLLFGFFIDAFKVGS